MIVADNWIWIHFPKCAGTSTEKMFRHFFTSDSSVVFDNNADKSNVIWHDTIPGRKERDPSFSPQGRKVYSNIRRLPTWLLSRVHFESNRTNSNASIDRQRFLEGYFNFPYKAAGSSDWTSRFATCDSVMERFSRGVTDWIRLENLSQDMGAAFGSEIAAKTVRENTGNISYIRDLSFWFTPTELQQLYEANPVWAEIESKVYGDIIRL